MLTCFLKDARDRGRLEEEVGGGDWRRRLEEEEVGGGGRQLEINTIKR
jgi:hypothetical protein